MGQPAAFSPRAEADQNDLRPEATLNRGPTPIDPAWCLRISLWCWSRTKLILKRRASGLTENHANLTRVAYLQRAHIVGNWPPIYIGKESDRHWEEGEDFESAGIQSC